MRASAQIVAVADGSGGTRLTTLRGEAPLLPRRTGPRGRAVHHADDGPPGSLNPAGSGSGSGEATVHLVGGAAGPLGGDRLRIEIEVGPDARLCVRTVAASLALPGREGGQSRLEITTRVGPGGRLRWLPEPLIGARGCDHLSVSTIELAAGASLVWREELVCGRHGEPAGDVRLRLTARYDGRTLLRSDLSVGPRAAGWAGGAVLGGGRATGSVLLVDPAWTVGGLPPAAVLGPSAALMPLIGGPAILASATGVDRRSVRAALDSAGDCQGAGRWHDHVVPNTPGTIRATAGR
jgi:urease accessory protein